MICPTLNGKSHRGSDVNSQAALVSLTVADAVVPPRNSSFLPLRDYQPTDSTSISFPEISLFFQQRPFCCLPGRSSDKVWDLILPIPAALNQLLELVY